MERIEGHEGYPLVFEEKNAVASNEQLSGQFGSSRLDISNIQYIKPVEKNDYSLLTMLW